MAAGQHLSAVGGGARLAAAAPHHDAGTGATAPAGI